MRHGLSALTHSGAERAECIERLAIKIAGDKTDPVILKYAHAVAEAELDLAQVRRVKIATIDRALAFGEFDAQQAFRSVGQATRFLRTLDQGSLKDSSGCEICVSDSINGTGAHGRSGTARAS